MALVLRKAIEVAGRLRLRLTLKASTEGTKLPLLTLAPPPPPMTPMPPPMTAGEATSTGTP